ncbi:hypothetical protein MTR_5g039080 [Medicago truncatula]|uniref:Uncharacterized protein n=1 Tax=Medicago truncatula TaxID=3880 RepID=G7KB67_MEDTR|nr:hypothetical protein MTR_5g039080 [Medicago truncatula]
MKINITCSLKSPQQMMVLDSAGSYLPDECWNCILKSFFKDDRRRYLNSLSLVSKQLLSITDSFRFSLTVYDQTHPFFGHLFKRFTNLTSLDFSHYTCDLDALLVQIFCFPSLNITSLKLPERIPTYGLLSQNITTLVSLTCSKNFVDNYDLLLICFPMLLHLILEHCNDVTEKGLKHVVENCINLRELRHCYSKSDMRIQMVEEYLLKEDKEANMILLL